MKINAKHITAANVLYLHSIGRKVVVKPPQKVVSLAEYRAKKQVHVFGGSAS